jgi:hypothetical protein
MDAAGTQRVHLLDLSITRALIHCDGFVRREGTATLGLNGRAHLIEIVTNSGARLGLRFRRKLCPAELDAALTG